MRLLSLIASKQRSDPFESLTHDDFSAGASSSAAGCEHRCERDMLTLCLRSMPTPSLIASARTAQNVRRAGAVRTTQGPPSQAPLHPLPSCPCHCSGHTTDEHILDRGLHQLKRQHRQQWSGLTLPGVWSHRQGSGCEHSCTRPTRQILGVLPATIWRGRMRK